MKTLKEKINEYLNDEQNLGMRHPPIVAAPPKMTKSEWETHQATHTPYMPRCKHCTAARAVRQRHPKRRKHLVIVPDIHNKHVGPMGISMDYMYLNEKTKGEQENTNNPPHLIVVDHKHGRLWAHRMPNNGVWGKAEWVPRRILQDLSNNGMQNVKLHIKTDQEPAMVNVQTTLQELSPNRTIPMNNPVGESECNGRVESAIRRIQKKVWAI